MHTTASTSGRAAGPPSRLRPSRPALHCSCAAMATPVWARSSARWPSGSGLLAQQRSSPRIAMPSTLRQRGRGSTVVVQVFDGLSKWLSPGKPAGTAKEEAAGSAPGTPASEEVEDEDEEEDEEEGGADMLKIDTASRTGVTGSEEAFGPLAVLLVGFMSEELDAFRKLMNDMEADMVKIVPCTRAQMAGTLQAALESEFPQYEQPALGTRRTAFLSGMFGAEVVEVISAYRESGLPPAVWAAAVPKNYGRLVAELVAEVQADNAEMTKRAQQAQMLKEAEGASLQ